MSPNAPTFAGKKLVRISLQLSRLDDARCEADDPKLAAGCHSRAETTCYDLGAQAEIA
jgi:hypothetical protein